MNSPGSSSPDPRQPASPGEESAWGRWAVISMVIHGLILAAATTLLTEPGTPAGGPGSGPFEVRLLGSGPETPAEALPEASAGAREAVPSPVLPEAAPTRTPAVEPPDRPEPAGATDPAESVPAVGPAGGDGIGTSSGSIPEGTMPRGTGGEEEARYQPPRLLAGALPIAPRDVEPLEVPPEIPVRILVGTDGRVKEIEPLLDGLPTPVLEAVRSSADAMRFAPARRGEAPVEAWFTMTFVHRR